MVTKLIVFIFSFLILTRFNIDPDLGWHLAIGRHLWGTGEIIRGDIFSWTMPGHAWGNYFFLYQIIVWRLFENLGYLATAFIFGLMAALAVLILLPRKISASVAGAVILAVAIASVSLGMRPLTFSFLFFAFLLLLLAKNLLRQWWASVFWFLFFALWANFHQGFIVGLLVLAFYLTISVLQKGSNSGFRGSIVLISAAALGTLATPFGLGLYRSIFWDLVGKNTWLTIAEYQPIPVYFPLNFLYVLSGLVLIYLVRKHLRRDDEIVWFFLGAILFGLGLIAANLSVFWCLMLVFLVSRYLDLKLVMPKEWFAKIPLIFSISSAVLVLIMAAVVNLMESKSLAVRLARDGYPIEAVRFLREKGYGDNLFNLYHWGGYIDWQVPSLRVFIDGRMTGWRKSDGGYILADYLAIIKGDCEVAQRWQIKTVLVETERDNPCFSDFREVYRDSVAKILLRDYN